MRSAGLLAEGQAAPPGVISALAARGLDVSAHRSHRVTVADLTAAGLVLGMSREHVRHAVVTVPETWSRAFTLKELVRRGEGAGPRQPGEPLAEWLARLNEGRDRAALLGDSPADDVADPVGGPPQAFADTVTLLDGLAARLARLCWGEEVGERSAGSRRAARYPRTACRGSGDPTSSGPWPTAHWARTSRSRAGPPPRSRPLSCPGRSRATCACRISG